MKASGARSSARVNHMLVRKIQSVWAAKAITTASSRPGSWSKAANGASAIGAAIARASHDSGRGRIPERSDAIPIPPRKRATKTPETMRQSR